MSLTAIVHAKAFTAKAGDKPFLDDAAVIIEDGKIAAVGQGIPIPQDAKVIDGTGKVVTPGFIDAHCHIGLAEDGIGWAGADGNETSDPITAEVRALDGIYPKDVAFSDAIAAGITCVQVDPGSANVIGGETLVMKTWGTVVDDMIVLRPSGMKAALGENPKRVYGSDRRMPTTRMGNAATMRKALAAAKDYLRKKEGAKDPEKVPAIDLKHEALIPVLKKELTLRVHCHRTDDILTAIRIAREFDINISLEHCTEGEKVASHVKESGFAVTVGPSLTSKSKLECKDIGFRTPVALSKAGVKLAIVTDHPVLPIQYLRICAGLAVRDGMDEEFALLAITRYPAEIAGIADKVGSLEPGKDADLVLWSKDPLEYDAVAELTFIDGEMVYENRGKAGGLE